MKTIIIAALLGYTSAIKVSESPDLPNSNVVFPYTENKFPSAAGLVQTSACEQANIPGIHCIPNDKLFATGMVGDEDMGQEITMKG
jgi:hypothetical protein